MAERRQRFPVLVVGSINMDLVMEVDRAPEGGETLLGRRYAYVPGGKGANQAVAAARLGLEVTFVGRVGADAHGPALKQNLVREGVAAGFLQVDDRSQTGFAAITVEPEGRNRIVVFAGANMAIREEDVARAFSGSYRAVMLNLEIPQSIVFAVCKLAREHDLPVVLDAGPVRELDFSRLSGLEIISPNEVEARAITGIECRDAGEAERAARRLLEIVPSRFAVIKLGERGALLYDPERDQAHHFPGYQVRAVDSTAAGDAFTAAMTAQYLRNGNLAQAIRFANAAGAISVTRLGAQPSLPSEQEVEAFVRRKEAEASDA